MIRTLKTKNSWATADSASKGPGRLMSRVDNCRNVNGGLIESSNSRSAESQMADSATASTLSG